MVKKLLGRGVWLLLPAVLLGAKGQGCAAEYQPGDGSSADWDIGTVPVAKGADAPMTCAWLESDNCWRQLATAARACVPDAAGTFSDERDVCALADGYSFELAGPISTPASGTTLFPVVDQRIVDEDGTPCFTSKILGVGRTAFAVAGQTVLFEPKPDLKYRVVCADGTSYANDVEGTCETFGAGWLARQAPGYTLTCQGGKDGSCRGELWGAEASGAATVVECR